jgi:hypothetical protein
MSHMSVSGLCGICESAEARFRCESCGTLVCGSHYDREASVCVACAESGGGRRM